MAGMTSVKILKQLGNFREYSSLVSFYCYELY